MKLLRNQVIHEILEWNEIDLVKSNFELKFL